MAQGSFGAGPGMVQSDRQCPKNDRQPGGGLRQERASQRHQPAGHRNETAPEGCDHRSAKTYQTEIRGTAEPDGSCGPESQY